MKNTSRYLRLTINTSESRTGVESMNLTLPMDPDIIDAILWNLGIGSIVKISQYETNVAGLNFGEKVDIFTLNDFMTYFDCDELNYEVYEAIITHELGLTCMDAVELARGKHGVDYFIYNTTDIKEVMIQRLTRLGFFNSMDQETKTLVLDYFDFTSYGEDLYERAYTTFIETRYGNTIELF